MHTKIENQSDVNDQTKEQVIKKQRCLFAALYAFLDDFTGDKKNVAQIRSFAFQCFFRLRKRQTERGKGSTELFRSYLLPKSMRYDSLLFCSIAVEHFPFDATVAASAM